MADNQWKVVHPSSWEHNGVSLKSACQDHSWIMVEYVYASENAEVAKGCIGSHKSWILRVVKLFLCHKKVVLFMEKKKKGENKILENKPLNEH